MQQMLKSKMAQSVFTALMVKGTTWQGKPESHRAAQRRDAAKRKPVKLDSPLEIVEWNQAHSGRLSAPRRRHRGCDGTMVSKLDLRRRATFLIGKRLAA